LEALAKEARDFGYPFACSCFNISQIIVLFFDLNEKPAMNPVSGAKTANRAQLNNFARLCSVSPESAQRILDELFCNLVQHLHETWKRMRASGNCTIMDFSSALREVHESNAAFWRTGHSDVGDFLELSTGPQYRSSNSNGFQLRRVLEQSISSVLHAMDVHILGVVKAFEKIFSGMKAKRLTCHEPEAGSTASRYGMYQPPTILGCTTSNINSTASHPSWLAKPVNANGFDLVLFFTAPENNTAMEMHEAVESARTQDNTEGVQKDGSSVPSLSSVPQDKLAPGAKADETLDADLFFREWGLGNSSGNIKNVDSSALNIVDKARDLDAFLETCLAPQEKVTKL
jgi:hypothetical protein